MKKITLIVSIVLLAKIKLLAQDDAKLLLKNSKDTLKGEGNFVNRYFKTSIHFWKYELYDSRKKYKIEDVLYFETRRKQIYERLVNIYTTPNIHDTLIKSNSVCDRFLLRLFKGESASLYYQPGRQDTFFVVYRDRLNFLVDQKRTRHGVADSITVSFRDQLKRIANSNSSDTQLTDRINKAKLTAQHLIPIAMHLNGNKPPKKFKYHDPTKNNFFLIGLGGGSTTIWDPQGHQKDFRVRTPGGTGIALVAYNQECRNGTDVRFGLRYSYTFYEQYIDIKGNNYNQYAKFQLLQTALQPTFSMFWPIGEKGDMKLFAGGGAFYNLTFLNAEAGESFFKQSSRSVDKAGFGAELNAIVRMGDSGEFVYTFHNTWQMTEVMGRKLRAYGHLLGINYQLKL